MPSFEEIQKARIAASFNTDQTLSELTKAEILDLEKGGKRALIGEKRTFGGREYIKTHDGWKFHGKGTGEKAQSHIAGALGHHVDNDVAIRDHAKEIAEDAGMKLDEFEKLNSDTKKELWKQYKRNNSEKETPSSTSTKYKNATDHFVEEDGKHYIDILDPDSGKKKFKPGDKVSYIDDEGKKHKGTISDREHEDGDMFEVDEDGDKKNHSFEDILNDSKGKSLIETIEHGSSDKSIIDAAKKELKDKFGYDYKGDENMTDEEYELASTNKVDGDDSDLNFKALKKHIDNIVSSDSLKLPNQKPTTNFEIHKKASESEKYLKSIGFLNQDGEVNESDNPIFQKLSEYYEEQM